ncbi:MAG: sporulation protein, partial [Candidatus Sericytochromatia bacterium]
LSGYAFWMSLGPGLGWGAIKSPAFTVARQGDGFTLTGTGLGHRVGMCQWGARGRALAGHSAGRILAAYYRGATIQ